MISRHVQRSCPPSKLTLVDRLVVFLIPVSLLLLAPSPAGFRTPEELIRLGNEAVHRGDLEAAERLYHQASERAIDPGLVAFNSATVAGLQGDARSAELNYIRALDDRDAPAARRARALYNRGVCLLARGGTAATYRTAVACFEQALDLASSDEALAADARNNLELAKILWNKSRAKEKSPPRPNDLPPDAPPEELPPNTRPDSGTNDPGGPDGSADNAAARQQAAAGGKGRNPAPRETSQRTPGAGSLPVILDPDRPENLSPDEARAVLKEATERIERDRKANARLSAGPERPHVRDW